MPPLYKEVESSIMRSNPVGRVHKKKEKKLHLDFFVLDLTSRFDLQEVQFDRSTSIYTNVVRLGRPGKIWQSKSPND